MLGGYSQGEKESTLGERCRKSWGRTRDSIAGYWRKISKGLRKAQKRARRYITERRPEYWVTCYHCKGRFYREISRRPQDSTLFLCDGCDTEYNELTCAGARRIWAKRVL